MSNFYLTISGDIIDEVQVTITKKHLTILCYLDGIMVEKYHNYRPLINKYHLLSYIEELTEGSTRTDELFNLIYKELCHN